MRTRTSLPSAVGLTTTGTMFSPTFAVYSVVPEANGGVRSNCVKSVLNLSAYWPLNTPVGPSLAYSSNPSRAGRARVTSTS